MRNRHTTFLLLVCFIYASAGMQAPANAQKRMQGRKKPAAAAPVQVIDPELKAAIAKSATISHSPNSDAIRLLDTATLDVRPDGMVVEETRVAYKLLNERARRLAEVSLSYNLSHQFVDVIRARTISKSGTIHPVNLNELRETQPYAEYALYDDTIGLGFSFPAIEDGCIVDYTYRKITTPLLLPGHFWFNWRFSGPHPVVLSRLVLHIPSDKPFFHKSFNQGPKPTVSANGRTKTYTWEMRDMAAVEMEPDMPGPSEIAPRLEVTTLPSWDKVSARFWELMRPKAVSNRWIKATVAKVTTGLETPEQKARAIYDWVAERVRYVGVELGLSAFQPHSAVEVYGKLYGDCKDKSTLLITMLEEAGIKAHPVLLHTEETRRSRDQLANPYAFNHCIVLAEIGNKNVWLDPTDQNCAFGDIPAGDRGSDALVIRHGEGEFTRVPPYRPEENGGDVTSRVNIAGDGSAEIHIDMRFMGGFGGMMREAIRSLKPDQSKQMMQALAQRLIPGSTLVTYAIGDLKIKEPHYTVSIDLKATGYTKRTGNLLVVPWAMNAGIMEKGNPYTKETRTWPIVNRVPLKGGFDCRIELPEGYSIMEVPKECDSHGLIASYIRKVQTPAPGRVVLMHIEAIVGEATVPAAEYAKVRSEFDNLIRVTDEQIVLKKND